MPRKYRLYYDKTNKCWFNYLPKPGGGRGRKVYLGTTRGKHVDRDAYERALAKWHLMSGFDLLDSASRQEYLATMRAKRAAVVKDDLLQPESSIAGQMGRYIIDKQKKCNLGDFQQGRVMDITYRIKEFVSWIGESVYDDHNSPTGGIRYILTDRMFHKYHAHIGDRVVKNELAKVTARAMWWVVKDFMHWCVTEKKISYHTTVDKLRFKTNTLKQRIEKAEKKILTFNEDEIFQLMQYKTNRNPFRLWCAMSLNLAWTSIDLSTCRFQHLQWEVGADGLNMIKGIKKIRTKSAVEARWPLWDVTSLLLTDYVLKNFDMDTVDMEQRIFSNRNGDPINRTFVNHKGQTQRRDAFYSSFVQARERFGIAPGKTPKTFRKTMATLMEEVTGGRHEIIVQWCLAHTETTTTRKFYANTKDIGSIQTFYDECVMNAGELVNIDATISPEEAGAIRNRLRHNKERGNIEE
jgi:integrase